MGRGRGWKSDDQTAGILALDVLCASLEAFENTSGRYWAGGFGATARRLEVAASKEERRGIYLMTGSLLRGGMGSINDVYGPDEHRHSAFKAALKQVHRIFGLSMGRILLDDTFMSQAWYRRRRTRHYPRQSA
ncbi:hypothetical protein [Pseudarthrobacter sp. NS4]|uniref:hypothetical protein n=1 Tax=Pseudarthrobacter sp. NS4 TaxID=2973976 RepID=UPI0021631666|nr:hypothetical protein [Pseudarthrobacter sp. NS4]